MERQTEGGKDGERERDCVREGGIVREIRGRERGRDSERDGEVRERERLIKKNEIPQINYADKQRERKRAEKDRHKERERESGGRLE